jgi:hypothetical protein
MVSDLFLEKYGENRRDVGVWSLGSLKEMLYVGSAARNPGYGFLGR